MPALIRSLLTGLIVAGLAVPAVTSAAAEEKPMQLKVSPSGYDAEANAALERQKKLLQKLEQADYSVRSICTNCGDQWKHQVYAPFNPLAALKPSGRTSEQD